MSSIVEQRFFVQSAGEPSVGQPKPKIVIFEIFDGGAHSTVFHIGRAVNESGRGDEIGLFEGGGRVVVVGDVRGFTKVLDAGVDVCCEK